MKTASVFKLFRLSHRITVKYIYIYIYSIEGPSVFQLSSIEILLHCELPDILNIKVEPKNAHVYDYLVIWLLKQQFSVLLGVHLSFEP